MMISTIHLDKRQPPPPMATTRVELHTTGTIERRHPLAPLASLDCSITEPLTDTHTSTTDTPTLSGYFECDQLSDMVDDSLFEITNAGCLSKSVFISSSSRAGNRHMATAVIEEAPTETNEKKVGENLDQDEDSGARTPTNTEHPEGMLWFSPQQQQRQSQQQEASKPKEISRPVANRIIVTDHQAYDYSSTSTIPARWAHQTANGNGHRQRSRSARGANKTTGEQLATAGDARVIHKSRRKTRSNPDVREEEDKQAGTEDVCAECQQELERLGKKKERRRFTFSLFNLFSSGASDNQPAESDDKNAVKNVCSHRQPQPLNGNKINSTSTGDKPAKASTSAGTSRRKSSSRETNGATTTQIKSRDSIRLMNQKKQRAVRLSQTFPDFQRDPSNEILLNLSSSSSQKSTAANQPQVNYQLRPSQSSYSVLKQGRFSSSEQNNGGGGGGGGNRSNLQRPTKSVKFTMHDKVMIVPSDSSSRAPGHANHHPPPAYLQPSAPIIKRSIPKSSSYSQTESNRNLEELLAKYAVNNELITELNERLRLTETIASPVSTLDIQVSLGGLGNNNNNNQVHSTTHKDNNNNNNNNEADSKDNQTIICAPCSENEQVKVVDTTTTVNSCCDGDPSESVPTSSLSSETDDGGFSKGWLDKQQRSYLNS